MQPLLASEDGNGGEAANGDQSGNAQQFSSSYILPFNFSTSMNKFLQLVAQFCELTKITADQKAQLEAAFNEIPENERSTEMQAAFSDIAARFSEDAGSSNDNNGTDGDNSAQDASTDANADGNNGGDNANAGDAAADTTNNTADTVAANEDGADGEETVTVKASEFKSMQASLAKMVRETRKNALTKQVEAMKFSESNKVGVVLPKHANEVVDFALSLSEVQAEKFLKIVGNLQATASKFSETGSTGAEAAEFSEEQVAFFTEKLGMSKDEALVALKAAQTK